MVKKPVVNIKKNEFYILPSSNDELQVFIEKFKIDMMEHIVNSIEFAMINKVPIIEIFQFKNSPFVVTLSDKEFFKNLEHIHNFCIDNEIYELCLQIEKLQKKYKSNSDEK